MSYACDILADSINPVGVRLTTFAITFPRIILSELNTHRMLSRNSASSRAIPTEQQIERALSDPFIPEFRRRVRGMGAGARLDPHEQADAQRLWLHSRDEAVRATRGLLDVDKARANRLLEPFMWHTAIVSATEWENFYALRDHEAAQPEFQVIASMMRAAQRDAVPDCVGWGEWHLPLFSAADEEAAVIAPDVSAGRCARVSYDRHTDEENATKAALRWQKLSQMGHWSPGEHPARSVTEDEWERVQRRVCAEMLRADREGKVATPAVLRSFEFVGNFRAWVQLRKHYPGEAVFTG